MASWDGPPDVIDVLRTGGFDNLDRGMGAAARRMVWTPLKVVTTNLRAGWLRANGVPYSAQAVVTEHFMRFAVPEAGEWLTVRTVVDDPALSGAAVHDEHQLQAGGRRLEVEPEAVP